MNRRAIHVLLMLASLVLALACGKASTRGGTETGNPETTATRSVTGSVAADAATTDVSADTSKRLRSRRDSTSGQSTTGCVADRVDAINSKQEVKSVDVGADCVFALDLPIRKAYLFRFSLSDNPVGFLAIDHNTTGYSPFVGVVSNDATPLALGRIAFVKRQGRAEQNFAKFNDRDSDGTNDFDDDDDDNDGVADAEEDDCDLDGIIDKDDEDDIDCDATAAAAFVLRVNPRNAVLFELIDRDLPVDVQFSCVLDPATITDATFRVVSSDGTAIHCQFQFPGTRGDGARCRHDNDRFEALKNYTATVDGVQCSDGRAVQRRSWTWRTATE